MSSRLRPQAVGCLVGSVIDLLAASRSNIATGAFDTHSQPPGLQGVTALVMALLKRCLLQVRVVNRQGLMLRP